MDVSQAKRDHALLPRWETELAALRAQLKGPTIRHGIDFAYGKPSPQLLRAAGVSFVCRYLSPDADKNLSRSEAEDYSQAGIGIVTVWESSAQASQGGHAAGVADAEQAKRQAHALGAPESAPIFFAVDYELQPVLKDIVEGYFNGALDVLGRGHVGAYGGLSTVELAYVRCGIGYLWQTLAWSGTPTRWYAHAHLRQIQNGVHLAGIEADRDLANTLDYGQWSL
jgi:hypothetical protein